MMRVSDLKALYNRMSVCDTPQMDSFFISELNDLHKSEFTGGMMTEEDFVEIVNDVINSFGDYKDELDFDVNDSSTMFCIDVFDQMESLDLFNTLAQNFNHSAVSLNLNLHILLFSSRLLFLNNKCEEDVEFIRNIVAHEICHAITFNHKTMDTCDPHGKSFLEISKKVHNLLGLGCDGATVSEILTNSLRDHLEKGKPDTGYITMCNHCGFTVRRHPEEIKDLDVRKRRCLMCNCPNIDLYVRNENTGEYELFKRGRGADKFKYYCRCTNCGTSSGFNRISRKYTRYMEMMNVGFGHECHYCKSGFIYLDMGGIIVNPETLQEDNSDAKKVYNRLKHPSKLIVWENHN